MPPPPGPIKSGGNKAGPQFMGGIPKELPTATDVTIGGDRRGSRLVQRGDTENEVKNCSRIRARSTPK